MTISRLQRYSQSFERALKLCCFRCRRCVYGKHISRRRDVQLYCFPHCGAVHRAHCSSPLTSDAMPARGHGAPLGRARPAAPIPLVRRTRPTRPARRPIRLEKPHGVLHPPRRADRQHRVSCDTSPCRRSARHRRSRRRRNAGCTRGQRYCTHGHDGDPDRPRRVRPRLRAQRRHRRACVGRVRHRERMPARQRRSAPDRVAAGVHGAEGAPTRARCRPIRR